MNAPAGARTSCAPTPQQPGLTVRISPINTVPSTGTTPSHPVEPLWWPAPFAAAPLDATVLVPASKSLTNRYLVLAALASSPSTIHNTLISRDTELMLDALAAFGVALERTVQADGSTTVHVVPPARLSAGPLQVQCGLAGTVMRFVPALAAVAGAQARFDGDAAARVRPMAPVLDALAELGAVFTYHGTPGMLPFTMDARQLEAGAAVQIDGSASSQFISALLLAGPALPGGLRLRAAQGPLASPDHIAMTVATLRELGAVLEVDADGRGWHVQPRPIAGFTVTVEPDLSNAGPFLAAALATRGVVRVPFWPAATTQVGGKWVQILAAMGAEVSLGDDSVLTVRGTGPIRGIDYADASELAPTLAALCALADSPSRLTGIGHLRGHETDRLAALQAELGKVGAQVQVTGDGLEITPGALRPADLDSYEDHRMATAGALLGLAVDGIRVADIATTSKTMPDFPAQWAAMAATAAGAAEQGAR
ncbi:3-phosphoshikimate 1-carboxyvinyltransferase [Glutamicibacter protophormiae]|uniref:3-phosphoshikimate 1-carboxyvinyltransferase n=1 Tax=Glutamicibacter protophormiae TaxID=37930 RepID=UPI002A83AF7F|nr:3-phosphoshikimate 1-carboxyvinyltransferase [Glutamicibacter protophormiae]WPR65942.1 3-phosphoshikimate 1-carboxyvinyltransferase [Glutamicibacter protophormiae]WPR69440.1 3-phosphoshikimate 1-carboxyvinyltransferase [Glutamicibacter protophormiae]